LDHNKLEVKKAQAMQRDFKKQVEEKRAKDMEQHAINFRKTIQEELVRTINNNFKNIYRP